MVSGCGQPTVHTGGDSPVTVQRLSATRLNDIHDDVSWVFSPTVVVIANDGELLPSDVVATLLDDASTCKRVEASWQLDEKSGLLKLSQRKADDKDFPGQVTLPISPAGHIRVNLAGRQYNAYAHGAGKP